MGYYYILGGGCFLSYKTEVTHRVANLIRKSWIAYWFLNLSARIKKGTLAADAHTYSYKINFAIWSIIKSPKGWD